MCASRKAPFLVNDAACHAWHTYPGERPCSLGSMEECAEGSTLQWHVAMAVGLSCFTFVQSSCQGADVHASKYLPGTCASSTDCVCSYGTCCSHVAPCEHMCQVEDFQCRRHMLVVVPDCLGCTCMQHLARRLTGQLCFMCVPSSAHVTRLHAYGCLNWAADCSHSVLLTAGTTLCMAQWQQHVEVLCAAGDAAPP